MTVLQLPTSSFSGIDLPVPEPTVAMSKARGDYVSELRVADPMWKGKLTTTVLSRRQLAKWEAFIARQADQLTLFDFVHPLYAVPSYYSRETFAALDWGGGPVGVAEVTTITDLRTLVVSGLPIGTKLQEGDRCSVVEGGKVAYRIVSADATAGLTSTTVALTPRLPLGLFTTAAQVKFLDPFLRARVARGSWSAPIVAGEPIYGSFEIYEASHEDV